MPTPSPSRISIRRLSVAIVAGVLLAAAAYFGLESRRMSREFYDSIDARPVEVGVDLARPGRITAPFLQTCQISHGEAIYLTVRPQPDRANGELLDGLEGFIVIHNDQGEEVQSLPLPWEVDPEADADQPILLANFHPFAKGNYTATINVTAGAPALAGTEQTIHAEYVLCGLERLPAMISGFVALLCGVPGLVLGVTATHGFVQRGLSPRSARTTEAGDAAESE